MTIAKSREKSSPNEGASAFILAGGESSRMGCDKALLELDGMPMIVRTARLVESITGAGGRRATIVGEAESYQRLGLRVIRDDWPGAGPLGGIATALRASECTWNLVIACDLPYLTREWLEFLIEQARGTDADAVLPMNESGAEPLCAMYRKSAEAAIWLALDHGVRKVTDGLAHLRVEYVEQRAWKAFDSNGLLFKNMNSPEDYAAANARLSRSTKGRIAAVHNLTMSEHYFEFRNVSKAFDENLVLRNVSFFIDEGETAVIMGRSGVGKSVSLKLLLGFLQPDEGEIIVAGNDVTHWTEKQFSEIRRRVTMVFQSGALFDSLTVAQNVAFPILSHGGRHDPNEVDARVSQLLEMLEVQDMADRLPSDLSTGTKRAVAIARALAEDPEAILYDEPTTMVDPVMALHVSDLILKLKQKFQKTSIVVTHDTHLGKRLADRVIFLHEGRVQFFGSWAELEGSSDPFLRNFLLEDKLIPALDATA